jgi:hypothetical protein
LYWWRFILVASLENFKLKVELKVKNLKEEIGKVILNLIALFIKHLYYSQKKRNLIKIIALNELIVNNSKTESIATVANSH